MPTRLNVYIKAGHILFVTTVPYIDFVKKMELRANMTKYGLSADMTRSRAIC